MYNIRETQDTETKFSKFVGKKSERRTAKTAIGSGNHQSNWTRVGKVEKLRMAKANLISHELLKTLALDEDSEVRAAVADRGNLSSQIQTILCLDECPDVRFLIAEDPATALSILRRLSQDENPYVAHRAQKTLFSLSREAIREEACFASSSTNLLRSRS
ncbi:MAG: hypothetical protein SFV17_23965 [Candidatus Obscuribacter sp.]|nr:hypothetical protein [Candidatus Melainabacteria bacterium]MDX1989768.1 hypothetical protein [Candidatus Obscuribacter sp.]